jgi:hypothetical protein
VLRPALNLLAALVVLAACTAGGGATGGPGANGPSREPSASPADGSGDPVASGGGSLPASITDPIVDDVATRLGVDPSGVTIVEATAETFPDGSLGCPEPGMMYTQALVDGYQVIVEANGTQLDYRGSAPGQFRICTSP